MTNFNFVDSAAKGYGFLWEHRALIARMSIVPFAVKLLCYVLIATLALTEAYLRQGWVLLPTYLAEGWLVACLLRLFLFDEPWPTRGERGRDEAYLRTRARAILAGIISYTLIKLVFSFGAGLLMEAAQGVDLEQVEQQVEHSPNPSFGAFLFGMFFLSAVIWSFRLLWIYIPFTMDVPLKTYLRKAGGYLTSFYMIGTWLLCIVPIVLVFMMLVEFLYGLFPSVEEGSPSALYQFVFIAVQSVVEIVLAVVTSIAMAEGIRTMLTGETEKNQRQDDDEDFF